MNCVKVYVQPQSKLYQTVTLAIFLSLTRTNAAIWSGKFELIGGTKDIFFIRILWFTWFQCNAKI